MNRDNQELEVKFYLSRRGEMEARILSLGARLGDPRVHEINLRFDTPDLSLLETGGRWRMRQRMFPCSEKEHRWPAGQPNDRGRKC